ncbi:DUF5677 domain-containing protein [Pectobacterium polaris]|uniref:DUF5677 domain-containing protein n=1 Tax=Pectobacterium polaris TaxID=2042057 RepID=UPI001968B8B9|nr:DUF5677 domain-containing protein [Pectobacterium polaris]MBN3218544.1 hypothetical protein [Pectobacterium polaris]
MKHNISKLSTLIKDANEIISHIKTKELEERVKIAISFFELFIQNNKSMILLIEGGFYNEALAIHRLSIEHFFNIFALIRKKDFLDIIKNSSSTELEKTTKILGADLEPNDYENINEDKKEKFKKVIEDFTQSPTESSGYSIYNAAHSSEVGGFYNSVYRILSLKYSHSTYLLAIKGCSSEEMHSYILNALDFLQITIALFSKEFPKPISK